MQAFEFVRNHLLRTPGSIQHPGRQLRYVELVEVHLRQRKVGDRPTDKSLRNVDDELLDLPRRADMPFQYCRKALQHLTAAPYLHTHHLLPLRTRQDDQVLVAPPSGHLVDPDMSNLPQVAPVCIATAHFQQILNACSIICYNQAFESLSHPQPETQLT